MSKIEEALKKMQAARAQVDSTAPAGDAQPAPAAEPAAARPSAAKGSVHERIVAFHHPGTALTETFKQFNTVIRSMSQGTVTTLAFTSAMKGEGKSVIALNFAVALAFDCEGSVCVVDGDLRNPSLHHLLGLPNDRGFADVLSGDLTLSNVVSPTPVEKLFFVPAGRTTGNSSELFSSRRAAQAVAELRERYDYTIFDTAPILPAADTIHLSSRLDGVVVVIHAGRTHRKQARRAVELLGHANVLGFILNKSEREETAKDYV